MFPPLFNCHEIIAGKLPHLAAETQCPVSEQNFGFADPARMHDDIARRWMAGRILVRQSEVESPEWNPKPSPLQRT